MRSLQVVMLALLATTWWSLARADKIPLAYHYTPCGDVQQPDCSVVQSPIYPDLDPAALEAALDSYYAPSSIDPALLFVKFNANGVGLGRVDGTNHGPDGVDYFIYFKGHILQAGGAGFLQPKDINDNNLIVGFLFNDQGFNDRALPFVWHVDVSNLSVEDVTGPNYGLPERFQDSSTFYLPLLQIGVDNAILAGSAGDVLLEPIYATPEPTTLVLLGSAFAGLLGLGRLARSVLVQIGDRYAFTSTAYIGAFVADGFRGLRNTQFNNRAIKCQL